MKRLLFYSRNRSLGKIYQIASKRSDINWPNKNPFQKHNKGKMFKLLFSAYKFSNMLHVMLCTHPHVNFSCFHCWRRKIPFTLTKHYKRDEYVRKGIFSCKFMIYASRRLLDLILLVLYTEAYSNIVSLDISTDYYGLYTDFLTWSV